MRNVPFLLGDVRKRASVDTVRSVLDYKGRDIVAGAPTATVFDAISELARVKVGALLVLSGAELVGILTERDYARKVILQGRSSKQTAVQEIMTPAPLLTVTSSHTVDECMRLVTNKRIRHLPVVDGAVLQGLVSIGDLVRTIVSAQAFTIDQLHAYIFTDYPS